MTREEAIVELKILKEEYWDDDDYGHETKQYDDTMLALDMAINALGQEPCDDCISRKFIYELGATCIAMRDKNGKLIALRTIEELPSVTPQEPQTGHCKDCKWWKDSDGTYRRGFGAESQCPINRKEVFEGNGYCHMFETQKSEEDNGKDK